jgi:mono/diheme cytochrome c family protein
VRDRKALFVFPGVLIGAALVALVVFVVIDSDIGERASEAGDPWKRGKRIYTTVCGVCHHPDPRQEYGTAGNFGPAIAGSSRELLELRVRHGKYPASYTPKRTTRLMTTFTLSDDAIGALHAFVSAPDARRDPDAK